LCFKYRKRPGQSQIKKAARLEQLFIHETTFAGYTLPEKLKIFGWGILSNTFPHPFPIPLYSSASPFWYKFFVNRLKPKNMKKIILLTIILSGVFAVAGSSYSHYKSKEALQAGKTFKDYKDCINACNECASQCNNCASMCLKEKDAAAMSRCIQLCMECASICTSASQLMSLGSENSKDICKVCADLCKKCSDECAKFNNDHCKKCAEACNKAAELCRKM